MKFLVLSDTHGRIGEAERLVKSLFGIDWILHLGDHQRDGWQLEQSCGIPTVAVRGNTDGSYSNDDYRIINTEYGKLYLSHGHMESVKRGPENLLYKASALGCKAALYGHTHMPVFVDYGGIYLLNPGSLTLPRRGGRGSYAIVNTGAARFEAAIFYIDPE